MKKKKNQIENDQFIEVYEMSIEFLGLNEDLGHKINIRDLIRNKINNQKPAEKFREIDSQIENGIPKLSSVLIDGLGSRRFYKELKNINDETDYKVKYDVGMIFNQLITFIDKVIKNSKNGYNGYKVDVK